MIIKIEKKKLNKIKKAIVQQEKLGFKRRKVFFQGDLGFSKALIRILITNNNNKNKYKHLQIIPRKARHLKKNIAVD